MKVLGWAPVFKRRTWINFKRFYVMTNECRKDVAAERKSEMSWVTLMVEFFILPVPRTHLSHLDDRQCHGWSFSSLPFTGPNGCTSETPSCEQYLHKPWQELLATFFSGEEDHDSYGERVVLMSECPLARTRGRAHSRNFLYAVSYTLPGKGPY